MNYNRLFAITVALLCFIPLNYGMADDYQSIVSFNEKGISFNYPNDWIT